MFKIVASIFAFTLFLFLTFLFRQFAEKSDNAILLALFSTLVIVFSICAVVSFLVCGHLLVIGGAKDG